MVKVDFNEKMVANLFIQQPLPAFLITPITNASGQIIDFEYSYCNNEMEAYSGVSKEVLIGSQLSNSPILKGEERRRQFFIEILEVYETNKRMVGTIYNELFNKYYGFTRQKVEGGVLTILQDRNHEYQLINQLEEQTLQLKEQRNLLDNILKHSPSGITVSEAIRNDEKEIIDWKTIVANEAAEMVTGRTVEDILQNTVKESDIDLWESPLSKAGIQTLKTGTPFIARHMIGGQQKWIEIAVAKMDEEHLINVFTDVTEIKIREQEIENSEKMLKDILETQLNIVSLFSPVKDEKEQIVDFRLRLLNKTAAKYTRVDAAELKGKLLSELFPKVKTNETFERFKGAYEQQEPLRFEIHHETENLNIWFDILVTPLQKDLMVCMQDVTESKKLQLLLEKSVEDLKRSNVMLEEFAYVSSHDLKEPIRKIRSFSDRLKTRLLARMDEDEKAMFERLERSASRMELLVEDLLAYSHVSQLPLQLERIDMNVKIRRVLEDLELAIVEKNATINVTNLPEISGHRRQIQQLFQNLISNSLKYSHANTGVEISISSKVVSGAESAMQVSEEDKNTMFHLFEIKDNGIGFEQKYAERIFQMFQRLHGKNEYSGTGVGLSIAKKVVENHKGYIAAESEPDKGATFKVLLPVDL